MGRYEDLIKLLDIEKQEWEKSILCLWIKKDGEEKVYQECLKILEEAKKSK